MNGTNLAPLERGQGGNQRQVSHYPNFLSQGCRVMQTLRSDDPAMVGIALTSTQGLARGQAIINTGGHLPCRLGRMF